MLSCEKAATETTVAQSENDVISTPPSQDVKNTVPEKENTALAKSLQGKWKQDVYPFSTVEFKEATVKFTEEGMEAAPVFEKFELGTNCPFETNNIKNNDSRMLLILPEKSVCEEIAVSNDTLILSGYSANTNSDYKILYLRSK